MVKQEVSKLPQLLGIHPCFHLLIKVGQAIAKSQSSYGIIYIKWLTQYLAHKTFSGNVQISSVQSLSRVRLFPTPWIAACQASLSITNSRSSLRLTSIESVMPSSHLILCRPLLLLLPIPPSISLFQWFNSSHEEAKVLEFQLQHQLFQWTPRADLL